MTNEKTVVEEIEELKLLAEELGISSDSLDLDAIGDAAKAQELMTPTQLSAIQQIANCEELPGNVLGALSYLLSDSIAEQIKLRKDISKLTALLADKSV